jgi:hypothetical protein
MARITRSPTPTRRGVTVRQAGAGDAAALAHLAALDSARTPKGATLLAESDARVVAALPMGSGGPIADPFEPTQDAVALLELRRAQLEAANAEPRRSLVKRMRSLFPRLA